MKKGHKLSNRSKEAMVKHAKNQKLFKAINADGDDIEGVRRAVKQGANLNSLVGHHLPLEEAIRLGKTKRFQLLLSINPAVGEKADINAKIIAGKDNIEMPLIFFAVSLGCSAIVQTMLENGVDPAVYHQSVNDYKLIHYAVYSDDCDTFDLLNTEGQALSDVTDRNRHTCLHFAAREGKIRMLKHLLKLGADPNCRDAQERTPIHLAALKGQKEAVAVLLNQESQEQQDIEGRNAFLFSVESGDVEVVKLVAPTLKDFLFRDRKGVGAMHIAAQKNDVKMMQFLVGTGHLEYITFDNMKRMPIHFSAGSNALETFNFLIQSLKAELENSFKDPVTGLPLIKVSKLNKKVKTKLIEKLLSWKDDKDHTVVGYAIKGNAIKILERLFVLDIKFSSKIARGNTLIHAAVEAGNAAIISLLHKFGVDNREINNDGYSAEDLAAEKGDVKVLDALKALPNSNFKLRDKDGIQPIHRAASAGKLEAVEWLLNNGGGALTDKDNLGRDCLFHAVRGDQGELVKHLVNVKGMELRAQCAKKLTVMHHAAFRGAKKSIAVLRDLGLSLDEKGVDGILPLHVVVTSNLVSMANYLIEIGADKQGFDAVGRNAWFYAAKLQTDEMRKCLRGHKVVLCADLHEMTPMHFAADNGNLESIKFFLKTNLTCLDRNKKGETPLDKVKKKISKAQSEMQALTKIPFAEMSNSKEELSKFNILRSQIANLKIVESYLQKQEALVSRSSFGRPINFDFRANESKQLRANLKREHDTEGNSEVEQSPQLKVKFVKVDPKDPSTQSEYSEASSKNRI